MMADFQPHNRQGSAHDGEVMQQAVADIAQRISDHAVKFEGIDLLNGITTIAAGTLETVMTVAAEMQERPRDAYRAALRHVVQELEARALNLPQIRRPDLEEDLARD